MRDIIIVYLTIKGITEVTNNVLQFLLAGKTIKANKKELLEATGLALRHLSEQIDNMESCSKKYVLEIERDRLLTAYEKMGGKL